MNGGDISTNEKKTVQSRKPNNLDVSVANKPIEFVTICENLLPKPEAGILIEWNSFFKIEFIHNKFRGGRTKSFAFIRLISIKLSLFSQFIHWGKRKHDQLKYLI